MFHTVEKYKTPLQILLGLIAVTFMGMGASQVAPSGSDYIVKVGNTEISEHELNNELQNAQAAGSSISRDEVFRSLLQRAYLTQGAKMMGIAVSDEQIKQIIVDDPNFHDASGKFDQKLLGNYLDQRRMTEDQFVEQIRTQFELQNLLNLVQSGILISDVQAEQLLNMTQASRTIRSLTFSPEVFAGQINADDAALQKFYQDNKKAYALPQAAKIEYVELSAKALAEKQTVTDEEVKKAFDEQAASLTPRREIAHIFFPVSSASEQAAVKELAEKVAAEAKAAPEKFAALAKQYSQDSNTATKGGSLGLIAKSDVFGSAFDDAAFSLPKNGISGVIEGKGGYHIVRVNNIQDKVLFEQEKERISAELKQKKASADFAKAREILSEEAFNSPNSLSAAATKLGLQVQTSDEWLSKTGVGSEGISDALKEAVFSDEVFKKKHNSEPVNIDSNTVWVIRAKETREASTAPFADVKDAVKAAYLEAEAVKLAEKRAAQVLADLKAGKAGELQWSPVETLQAQQARQSMPPQAYAELLKARPQNGKSVYVLLSGLPNPVILEVQSINKPDNLVQQIPSAKQVLMQQQSANIFDSLIQYLSKKLDQKQGLQKVNQSGE